ncbi:MAG: type II/IV secretion system ATPase subunit [Chloroflexi bacterium]|nr:type II/IV secretion system ATPase subunit [Chloroflexota bacterium]
MTTTTAAIGAEKMRRRQHLSFAHSFVPTRDQAADARRYLSDKMDRDEMNPVALASGGKAAALGLLREAVNSGYISNVGKTPPEGVLLALYEHTLGMGALENFLSDQNIEQINVLAYNRIFVQKQGAWSQVNDPQLLFPNHQEYMRVVHSLVRRVGEELSPYTRPILDVRFDEPILRININQTQAGGIPALYIRRGRSEPFSVEQLIEWGDFDRAIADLLIEAAQRLIGCVFIGVVGTGKTVLLEMYLNHLPNVPIAVVDDAGDCTVTHDFASTFFLPGTAYSIHDEQVISLGGLSKAALRTGDVLAIAEIRGAEEAGIAISEAPSMRCVTTTFHGNTPVAGLDRLVSTAQRPPSPYAGINNTAALRRDVANAFPLVVHMERAGDRRFISGVYHNRGWGNGSERWDLTPLASVIYLPDGSLEWEINSQVSLDDIRVERTLDRVQRVQSAAYEAADPQKIYQSAMQDAENGNMDAALHKMYKSLAIADTEQTREQLLFLLERSGDAPSLRNKAAKTAKRLQNLIQNKNWQKAKALLDAIKQRPIWPFMRKVMSNYGNAKQTVVNGANELARVRLIIDSSRKILDEDARVDILEGMLEQVKTANLRLLDANMTQDVKLTHMALLEKIIQVSPSTISQRYFKKQLEQLQ